MYQLVCNYFVIYFGFLVEIPMNQSAPNVNGESVESISFFIAYICNYQYMFFHSDYNCNQGVNMLQKLPHNLTIAQLLHKYSYSLVKYRQNVAYKFAVFKRNFFV